ncbi:MAG: HAD family hydrolase [Nitrososphaerales archaeon]
MKKRKLRPKCNNYLLISNSVLNVCLKRQRSKIVQILWLFFDIGETLLSEKNFHSARNDGLFEVLKSHKKDLNRAAYDEAHKRAILSRPGGESSRVRAIAREILGPNEFYKAVSEYQQKIGGPLIKQFQSIPTSLFQPYNEVRQVLEYLSKKHSLGIIANQHRNVRGHMDKTWGLATFFSFMILSEEVGFNKPDREMFKLALDKARIEPNEAWMIGDRVDTDIGPARSLGIRAIRVLHDSEMSIITPDSEFEVPDFQFKDLKPLLDLF